MNSPVQFAAAEPEQLRQIAQDWLDRFNGALERADQSALEDLLAPDGYWRDLLAHQWDFRALKGPQDIASTLILEGRARGVRDFTLHPDYSAPKFMTRSGRRVLEVFVHFLTALGTGSGLVRLEKAQDGTYRAWGLMTSLQSLESFPEAIGKHRPERVKVKAEGENWLDRLEQDRNFDTEEPEALVVGAGHSGLMIAARLKAMGARTLVIESLPRVGDIWRNRYHTLQLHNEIDTIDFPYVSYPLTWPTYVPKDMYAAWMEFYALAMELPVWTSVSFLGAERDDVAGNWAVRLKMPDGAERIVRRSTSSWRRGVCRDARRSPNCPVSTSSRGPSPIRPMSGRRTNIAASARSSWEPAQAVTTSRSNSISAVAT